MTVGKLLEPPEILKTHNKVDQQIAELNAAGTSQYQLKQIPDTDLYRVVVDGVPGPGGSLAAVRVWLSYEIVLPRTR